MFIMYPYEYFGSLAINSKLIGFNLKGGKREEQVLKNSVFGQTETGVLNSKSKISIILIVFDKLLAKLY